MVFATRDSQIGDYSIEIRVMIVPVPICLKKTLPETIPSCVGVLVC